MKRSFLTQCIVKMVNQHRVMFFLFCLLLVATVLISLVPAQVLRYLIDGIFEKQRTDLLFMGALAYYGVLVLTNLFELAKETGLAWIGQSLTQLICNEMMAKLTRIKTSYFTKEDPAYIASYFLNDAQTISSVFSNGVIAMIVNCFKIIGILVTILLFSKELAILLVILLPLLMIFTRFVQKKMLTSQMENRLNIANMTKTIADSVHTARIMKVFHRHHYHQKKFEDSAEAVFTTNEKINFFDSLYSPITQIVLSLVIVFIVFLTSGEWISSQLTIGMCAASVDLMTKLFAPIESLGMELQSIQQAVSGIRRINRFYEIEEETIKRNKKMEDLKKNDSLVLKFDHVFFEYDQDVSVLKDVSFVFDQSRRNVIIGRTGVGKSTLFNLVMGLYPPTKGSITINGIHPHEIRKEDLRKIFGRVDQNFMFILGTLKEQITLKDERYSDEDVIRVMKLCGLHETAMSLEKGYDTIVNENSFSKGQCQLLSIARALIANPLIFLLDEMSANLDVVSEKKMLEVIDQIAKDHLILSITHHQEILREEDHLIYLKDGKVEQEKNKISS